MRANQGRKGRVLVGIMREREFFEKNAGREI